MTSDVVPAGGDPRRLLADVRGLSRRVRLARRVTWLPLLVLAVVTFGAIPASGGGPTIVRDCRAADGGEVCKVWEPVAQLYWLAALLVAYAVIAGRWQAAPMLVITGGLLLLGSAGFALAPRLRRPR
ncbi:hypothetical protein [Micromonospora echinofusca]|uniref:Uncharacterized protein n=1 Tax=Micromonospora echinofusca TaxID=47858 RepID=A0A1C5G8E7_MICEH|nr:hypothetical protein [Micromonospora echinofusca]SCG16193.1 hypothetical protein GA0070610_2451 [Micromonospora echinofusca]